MIFSYGYMHEITNSLRNEPVHFSHLQSLWGIMFSWRKSSHQKISSMHFSMKMQSVTTVFPQVWKHRRFHRLCSWNQLLKHWLFSIWNRHSSHIKSSFRSIVTCSSIHRSYPKYCGLSERSLPMIFRFHPFRKEMKTKRNFPGLLKQDFHAWNGKRQETEQLLRKE